MASRSSSIRASSARACQATSWRDGIVGARVVICNDYELELIRQKTGLGEADILERADAAGRHARRARCRSLTSGGRRSTCRPCRRTRIADPTGVGDAYRGGFMKGLVAGADVPTCAQLGSVAATYALEHLGGSSHAYTLEEFRRGTSSTSVR